MELTKHEIELKIISIEKRERNLSYFTALSVFGFILSIFHAIWITNTLSFRFIVTFIVTTALFLAIDYVYEQARKEYQSKLDKL